MDAAEPKRYGHTLYDDFALERVEGVDDDEVIFERFAGSQPSRWSTMAELKEDGGFSPVTRLVPTGDTRGAADAEQVEAAVSEALGDPPAFATLAVPDEWNEPPAAYRPFVSDDPMDDPPVVVPQPRIRARGGRRPTRRPPLRRRATASRDGPEAGDPEPAGTGDPVGTDTSRVLTALHEGAVG